MIELYAERMAHLTCNYECTAGRALGDMWVAAMPGPYSRPVNYHGCAARLAYSEADARWARLRRGDR